MVHVRDIELARLQFNKASNHFLLFHRLLQAVAPTYDCDSPPGPPFDMYYHLEIIDRLSSNMTAILQEMREEWQLLQ